MSCNILEAIKTSILEDRSVFVTSVGGSFDLYAEVSAMTDECDCAEVAPGEIDCWGTLDGDAFRLRFSA